MTCLTSILIDPVQENVHGSSFGDLVVVSVQPEYLLTPELLCFILGNQRSSIVPTETRSNDQVIVPDRPVCADFYPPSQFAVSSSTFRRPGVLRVGPEGEAFRTVAEVRARQTDDHVQQGAGRPLHAQTGLR